MHRRWTLISAIRSQSAFPVKKSCAVRPWTVERRAPRQLDRPRHGRPRILAPVATQPNLGCHRDRITGRTTRSTIAPTRPGSRSK